MSDARTLTPESRILASSSDLDLDGEEIVEGRRRTVKVGREEESKVEER